MTRDMSRHLANHRQALNSLDWYCTHLENWGETLFQRLTNNNKLLVAGNGGSAAQAQHLTAELVGRYQAERPPLSALALHAETSSLTAISNDYGGDHIFARQVEAHGRAGDILLLLSTSGESENLVQAARCGSSIGVETWALTGPAPNRLQQLCDSAVTIEGDASAVQEVHLVAIHILCKVVEQALVSSNHKGEVVYNVSA